MFNLNHVCQQRNRRHQDIQEISTIAHEHVSIAIVTPQAFGKIPLSINDLGLDYASISSLKCYAPKGVGGLIVKDKDTLPALLEAAAKKTHSLGHKMYLES